MSKNNNTNANADGYDEYWECASERQRRAGITRAGSDLMSDTMSAMSESGDSVTDYYRVEPPVDRGCSDDH